MPLQIDSFQKLFIDMLKDLYSAENQLVEALPEMAKAASSSQLKQGFEKHLSATKGQVKRLEELFGKLEYAPGGKKCVGMASLIAEGEDIIKEEMDAPVKDAALIAAAQKVEHYEMAGYGTARTFAELLGDGEAVRLLQATLDEEKKTDEQLTRLAESHINRKALRGG